MNSSQVRKRTKILAKTSMNQVFLPLVLVLLLELGTVFALSYLASALASKFFSGAVITVWKYTFNYASVLLSVVLSAFSLPLTLGATEYMLKIVRRKEAHIGEVFSWFADGTKLAVAGKLFIWNTVFAVVSIPLYSLPSAFVANEANVLVNNLYDQAEAGAASLQLNWSLLDWSAITISLAMMLIYLVLSACFAAVPYFFADNPGLTPFGAAASSFKVMRRHIFEYIVLLLSFAGWYILCFFTFFIVGLYLLPYFKMTITIFVEYARADHSLNEAPDFREIGPGDQQ